MECYESYLFFDIWNNWDCQAHPMREKHGMKNIINPPLYYKKYIIHSLSRVRCNLNSNPNVVPMDIIKFTSRLFQLVQFCEHSFVCHLEMLHWQLKRGQEQPKEALYINIIACWFPVNCIYAKQSNAASCRQSVTPLSNTALQIFRKGIQRKNKNRCSSL